MAGKLRAVLGVLFTATLIGNAACSGDTGPAGPAGKQGPQGDPGTDGNGGSTPGEASVSAVTPADVFIARTVDVVISGDNTEWDSKTTVDFGSSVTVNKITVASPTAILANVSVKEAAGEQSVDVKVDDLTYKGAFSLHFPVDLGQPVGKAEQGGALFVSSARGLDFNTPFDTTTDGNPFATNYIDLFLKGQTMQIFGASDYSLTFLALYDVDAPAGSTPLEILSGPANGAQTVFPAKAVDVTARTPKTITPGTTATFTPSTPLESGLFQYTPADATGRIAQISVSSDDPNAAPVIYVLDSSGKFSTALASFADGFTYASGSTDKIFVVALDTAGGTTAVKVDIDETAVTAVHDTEPNNDTTKAGTVAALPAAVVDGKLTSDSDEDWFVYTATAADLGKSFHVTTFGDALTDTVVDVLAEDGTTSLGGPSDDQDYNEDFTSDPITAPGTYYIKIYASPSFDPAHSKYFASIDLE
jgi:hypothetical protein